MSNDLDLSFIAEALPVFVSEAREQVDSIELLLLQLETAPDDRELMGALFRCAHTVKGSAGIFGLDRLVGFTHHVETLLDRLRAGELRLTPALGTLLLQCNDQIRGLVDGAGGDSTDDDRDDEAVRAALVQRLQAAVGQAAAGALPPAAAPAPAAAAGGRWQVAVRFGADTWRHGMDPQAILAYLAGRGDLTDVQCDTSQVPPLDELVADSCHLGFGFVLDGATRQDIDDAFGFVSDDCTLQIQALAGDPAPPDAAPEAAAAVPAAAPEAGVPRARGADAGADEQRFIRVQADRLDAVINLLGELVIAGAGAQMLAQQAGQRALVEANAQVGRLIEEVRNGTLQMRMVPIGETFARFRRVVRDTATELGKDVQLELLGGETELDKSVVERIADPLMHLVRNALDHGLEKAEERAAAGKPRQGRLTLSACHEAGGIVVRIDDDGRGIQRRKVLERAWERGLIERGTVPADADIDALIFEPGFSTAEQVTNLSGRGVGMDVVRRNIEALRGTVSLASTPGQGSRIEIRLPLTLAIIDGFLVGVGDSRFIFPLDAVVEVVEPRALLHRPDVRGRGLLELRGQALPVVGLRELYALGGQAEGRGSVVVLKAGERRLGVLVDSLHGQHQTVIKPLGRMFRSLRGLSGSSVLGTGEVALIFDVHALAQMAVTPPALQSRGAEPATAAHSSLFTGSHA
jgi:two-component system chemotaxis sensor kinase CheA